MKLLKKNQIIIYVFILMLITAGYLNYTSSSMNQDLETSIILDSKDETSISDIGDAALVSSTDVVFPESENEEVVLEDEAEEVNNVEVEIVDEYFTKSKIERDNMYSQMIETYESVLNSDLTSETQKQSATEQITKVNETKNQIMICENLIELKEFQDSVIFVNDQSVNVIIKAEEINPEDIAQIQNIIARELKVDIQNIHITNKK